MEEIKKLQKEKKFYKDKNSLNLKKFKEDITNIEKSIFKK